MQSPPGKSGGPDGGGPRGARRPRGQHEQGPKSGTPLRSPRPTRGLQRSGSVGTGFGCGCGVRPRGKERGAGQGARGERFGRGPSPQPGPAPTAEAPQGACGRDAARGSTGLSAADQLFHGPADSPRPEGIGNVSTPEPLLLEEPDCEHARAPSWAGRALGRETKIERIGSCATGPSRGGRQMGSNALHGSVWFGLTATTGRRWYTCLRECGERAADEPRRGF